MAAFYSLLCKAIKKQPAGRSGRLFWRSGRDSNPRVVSHKLISSQPRYDRFDTAAYKALLHAVLIYYSKKACRRQRKKLSPGFWRGGMRCTGACWCRKGVP